MTRFTGSAATDPGGRAENEDACLSRPDLGLWAVADGAGGHANGAAASQAVVTALETIPPGLTAAEVLAQVRLRLDAVHRALLSAAADQGEGCVIASTVVVLIARGAHFACLWAGDSRAYRLRDGRLEQLTRDHSVVQTLVDQGALDAAEADRHPEANVITRAVGGGEPMLQLDKLAGRLMNGDRFLLSSDGLHKTLSPDQLAALLIMNAGAAALIGAALQRGPRDNITAATLNIVDDC